MLKIEKLFYSFFFKYINQHAQKSYIEVDSFKT